MQHNFCLTKPYGLANQKVRYIQFFFFLNIEKSGEQEKVYSKECLVHTDQDFMKYAVQSLIDTVQF